MQFCLIYSYLLNVLTVTKSDYLAFGKFTGS